MSEWISVKEDEPPRAEFQGWLVTASGTGFWEPKCILDEDGRLGVWGIIDYDCEGWDFGLTHLELTHWQLQPKPPKENKDE